MRTPFCLSCGVPIDPDERLDRCLVCDQPLGRKPDPPQTLTAGAQGPAPLPTRS